MELALCTTPIFVVIFCPLLFFMQATLIKKAGLVGGTDYMAVVSSRVFVISFSIIRNGKRQKRIDYVEVYVVCLYSLTYC